MFVLIASTSSPFPIPFFVGMDSMLRHLFMCEDVSKKYSRLAWTFKKLNRVDVYAHYVIFLKGADFKPRHLLFRTPGTVTRHSRGPAWKNVV